MSIRGGTRQKSLKESKITATAEEHAEAIIQETLIRLRAPSDIPKADPDPVKFVREVLKDDPTEQQEEILRSIVDNERTAVPKCHSSGGTRAAAYATCWWLHRYDDGIVWTLAPTTIQVKELLWRDIEDLYNKAEPRLGGRIYPTTARWDFGPRRYALGRSTRKVESLQGPHGGHILIIIDEASGFPDVLEGAVEGMLASGHTRLLMLSQPTRLSGMFYQACHRGRSYHNVIHMDGLKQPNFGPEGVTRPYLLKPDWVELMRMKWGEKHPLWQIRVRGQFPAQATDSLISITSIEEAFLRAPVRWPKNHGYTKALGVDVARFGSDYTAYALLNGPYVAKMWRESGKNLMETAGQCAAIYRKDPDVLIVVDDTGLGGGVVDRLRELEVPTLAVNFGAKAREEPDYLNKAAEIWFNLAKDFTDGELYFSTKIDNETRDTLMAQLIQPTYTYTSTGKLKLMKLGESAGESSPDLGDALALAREGQRAGYQAEGRSLEPKDEAFPTQRENIWGGQADTELPSSRKGAWRR